MGVTRQPLTYEERSSITKAVFKPKDTPGGFKGVISDVMEIGIPLALCILLFITRAHPVSGQSMFPTLENGQYIISSKVMLKDPAQGDIVVARSPQNDGKLFIKRVAAVSGDLLRFTSDGKLYVNDVLYPYGQGNIITTGLFGDFERDENGDYVSSVPEGTYYLIGDNFEHSADSRVYGPFDRSSIVETVIWQ